jgi:hypothetical protein
MLTVSTPVRFAIIEAPAAGATVTESVSEPAPPTTVSSEPKVVAEPRIVSLEEVPRIESVPVVSVKVFI